MTCGWYLRPILFVWSSAICCSQKNFMWGVDSKFWPPIILRRSVSRDALISTPSFSIFVWRCSKRSWSSLHSSLVAWTVARSFSVPHAASDAFDLAGSAEAFDFRLTALLTELKAVAHGWQEFFSADIASFIIRNQQTDMTQKLQSWALQLLALWTRNDVQQPLGYILEL